jgi:UDP-3-O-[3-hydroxymyristoyl] glucosamine N-acyltransferase
VIGENVKIGNHVTIHPGVVIYADCVIGNHVTIHSGSIIGSDGFGFAPKEDGSFQKVPQL